MNRRFILVISEGGYGYWGTGATVAEALVALRKSSGKRGNIKFLTLMFTSELPFAPSDRTAYDGEADAWIGRDGSLNYVRCEKTDLG